MAGGQRSGQLPHGAHAARADSTPDETQTVVRPPGSASLPRRRVTPKTQSSHMVRVMQAPGEMITWETSRRGRLERSQ